MILRPTPPLRPSPSSPWPARRCSSSSAATRRVATRVTRCVRGSVEGSSEEPSSARTSSNLMRQRMGGVWISHKLQPRVDQPPSTYFRLDQAISSGSVMSNSRHRCVRGHWSSPSASTRQNARSYGRWGAAARVERGAIARRWWAAQDRARVKGESRMEH